MKQATSYSDLGLFWHYVLDIQMMLLLFAVQIHLLSISCSLHYLPRSDIID
jgi:hypothetical protein